MDIFSPTIIDNAIITGSNNASLLQVSSPSAASAFFISGSGRVGIGTTSPLSTLTVADGNINIGSGYGIGGNNLGTYSPFIRYSTNAGIPSSSFGHTSAYMLSELGGVFGANDLSFYAGAITQPEIMRIQGSTGFVGIGETSPSAKLEIRGSGATSATTALRVENSNTSASLVVTNDIRVGINKTTPNSELDVNGTVIVTGSITSTSNITTLGSVATPTQTISGVNGWAPTSGTTNLLNIAGNLVPTATAIINSLAITSTVSQSVNPTTIIRGILVSPTFNTLGPQYRGFEWNNNQGFGLYGVGAAPNYLSGSLGIGTTSPSASLHISGASNVTLLRVGSPTNDNILFVTGSGRVGINTTSSAGFLGGNISTFTIFQNSGSGDGLTPSTGLQIVNSGSSTSAQAQLSIVTVGDKFAAFNIGTSGSGTQNNYWHLSKRNAAASHSLNLYNNNQGSFSSPLFSFIAGGSSYLGEGAQIQIDAANNRVGLQLTPSDYIHLYSEPGAGAYLRIDATQTSNDPQQSVVPGTFNYVAGPGTDDAVLGLPNYWMEIKLNGTIVLIPCYLPA